ncbi:MAG: VWFA-related Acidobacterial domain protein [Acidobacteria bacterium]|nr:VWFA-related Acidobacterial domain protein [Acidobacteriota bacterium]
MQYRRAAVLLAFLALPAAVAGRPQAPSGAGQSQGTPQAVFKAGVELVRLDVRVLDADGLPITDLRADEITIREGGADRPVVLFQHVEEPRGTYQEIARRTVGAEVSTNRGAPRGNLFVLAFDQNHIRAGNEQRARLAAERFVRTRLRPGDRVALYALPGPGPQVPFTANRQAVLAGLPEVRGALDRESVGPVGAMTDFEAFQIARGDEQVAQRVLARAAESGAALDAARSTTTRGIAAAAAADSPQMVTHVVTDAARTVVDRADAESRAFLKALSDVIRNLAPIEGRKTVVLVSEGFFTDNLVHDVEDVAAAAAQSYAVIYSLDINARGVSLTAAEPTGAEPAAEIQSRLEALGTLANETDGELMIDVNSRPDGAFARIADHSQDYYIVGFEAPAEALADRDRYRRLSVSVRRPGARASTRTGYSLRDPASGADRRRSIDIALSAPFPQQGLPIEMTTYVLRGTDPGTHRVVLSLEAELPAASPGAPASADVVFVARSTFDGRTVASGTDTMRLPARGQDGALARGAFRVQFEAPPGEYLMRVVVREPGGTAGSVDRRFEVRNFDGIDLTASDLVLGGGARELPVRAVGYVDEGITGSLELYARREADIDAAEVTLEILPQDGDAAVSTVRADLQETRAAGAGFSRRAAAELPLAGFAPGEYVVRARVSSGREAVTELSRQLRVLAGPPPPAAARVPEAPSPELVLRGDLVRALIASFAGPGAGKEQAAAAGQAAAGAWETVLRTLGPGAAGDPPGAQTLRGLALFGTGRYDDAARALQAVLDSSPREPRVAFVLGWVHALASRETEAVTAWRNAVRQDPAMVPAYLALADAYVRLSHAELAAQVLEEGLRVVPASPELAGKLAEVKGR